MSIFSRILAFLNVIAAIVTLYFLAQVYVARMSWERALRGLNEQLTGIDTPALLDLVRQEHPEQVAELEKNPPQSDEGLRVALLQVLFPREKSELLLDERHTESLRQRYGLSYDDLRSVLEDRISRVHNELRVEEQNLVNRRRDLEIRRRRLEEEIRLANERVLALKAQIDTEQAQHAKILAQIHARRQEVVFWLARLAEAFAARQLTQSVLEDMQAEYAHVQAQNEKLIKECEELANRIHDMERRLALRRQAP
ncbi:MAG: hypothetical protein RMI91_00675 [Gemmatales bacterium]|nr:hypothetical protein [Gemmatales bacterium]MDW7993146.1 hypothetical protein [Gemmatales bacterium]